MVGRLRTLAICCNGVGVERSVALAPSILFSTYPRCLNAKNEGLRMCLFFNGAIIAVDRLVCLFLVAVVAVGAVNLSECSEKPREEAVND